MTTTVVVTGKFVETPLPANVFFDHILVGITDSVGAKLEETIDGVTIVSASFDATAMAPGSLTATMTALDKTGTAIGSPMTGTGTLPAPPASFPSPSSVVVNVTVT
jgi:hypothetical protein